jgi:hypothetical protein
MDDSLFYIGLIVVLFVWVAVKIAPYLADSRNSDLDYRDR